MTLNSIVTESPILLFLGAGASVPLGKPTMQQFVLRFQNSISHENESTLLSVLISARGPDLEAILNDLETFLGFDYVTSLTCEIDSFAPYEATREDATRLRSIIRHAIIREYRTMKTDRLVTTYQPLFNTIFNHLNPATHCLPVFTTNYDLAIENFCSESYPDYDLTDGMEEMLREVFWNPNEFENFRIDPQKRNIVLFKLHGSVNWMRLTSNGKIVQSLPMYDVVDSDEYQNAIIYTAGNKVATLDPYLTGYHYFSRCCEYAKLIIAIGYSFRDYEALANLLKARQVNDDLNLILLSPDAYTVLATIPDKDGWLWTWAVSGNFGDTTSEAKYLYEIDRRLGLQLKK